MLAPTATPERSPFYPSTLSLSISPTYRTLPSTYRTLPYSSGLSSAAEVAYYSYMYAIVDERNYKRVSSYIRYRNLIIRLPYSYLNDSYLVGATVLTDPVVKAM